MTNREYEVGKTIKVPWGLDTVEGVVVGAYGEGSGRRILVEINVGDGVTETLPFPQRALDATRNPEIQSPPGSWVKAARYEEYVRSALETLLSDKFPTWEGETWTNFRLDDRQELDFVASLPDRVLVVEVKYYSSGGHSRDSSGLERLASALMTFRSDDDAPIVGLLVMNAEPAHVLHKQTLEYRRSGIPVWVVACDPEKHNEYENLNRTLDEVMRYRIDLTSSEK